MAEQFQGAVCGGSWWNPANSLFSSSPCSPVLGSFGWPIDHLLDMKTTRSVDEGDMHKSQQAQLVTSNGNISIDSSLQTMGISLSSPSTTTDHWNHDLLHDTGKSDGNYSHIPQDLNSGMNYVHETEVEGLENFATTCQDSSMDVFNSVSQGFSLNQQPLNPMVSSSEVTATCPSISTGYQVNSASYGYTSSLLQTLFGTDSPPQQSLIDNQATNYPSNVNYMMNSNEFLPSFPKQQLANCSQFSTNAPFFNTKPVLVNDIRTNFFPSTPAQFLPSTLDMKSGLSSNNITKTKMDESGEISSLAKKNNNEPASKRPRIETPSPLPTFKVRKEKLGDRVTALQQLVSPFGKTDTASVLNEAIEYIKFLHDQVNVLSTPYMKNGSPSIQFPEGSNRIKDQDVLKQDLRSRGLCLVPISSTFPVASETTADFWTPNFGGAFS